MPTLRLEHGVADFDRWKAAFDSDPVDRKGGGVREYRIARAVDDPSYVLVDLDFDTTADAEAFLERLQAMWREAGPRLGFDTPQTRIIDVVESATV